jgi:DNA-binding transcriptional regulator YdaS (Cro superfamily)
MDDNTSSTPVGADALRQAITVHGISGLAARIGVRYQLIQGWLDGGRKFAAPAEHCPSIERETGVPCEQLRPDVDWAVLRRKSRKAAA